MGRQLKSISGNGKEISCKYNDSGIRTEKTVNGVTTKYYLSGDAVTLEDNGTDKIYYTYDADGDLISMNLNGKEYFYIRNVQNDVIGLHDSTGTVVVNYSYDTWGNIVSITGSLKDSVGKKNPYRYRGYRYDEETGLYYLQSRYYNAEWGRFINADAGIAEVGSIQGYNMFQYCNNNPVNMSDESGYLPKWMKKVAKVIKKAAKVVAVVAVVTVAVAVTVSTLGSAGIGAAVLASAAIGAVVGGVSNVVKQKVVDKKKMKNINVKETAIATVTGAVGGGLAATGIGLLGQVAGAATLSGSSAILNNQGPIEVVRSMAVGAFGGVLGGAGAYSSMKSEGVKALFFTNTARTKYLRDCASSAIFKGWVVSTGNDYLGMIKWTQD